MSLIRTPDSRFAGLPGYPFAPHYLDVNGARVHYLDEGAGQAILCLHGEPTWSYLYRKLIPMLSEVGRVVAPDFVGFGKSDKFAAQSDYSFQMHRDTLAQFITSLDLRGITLIVHDWGGLIGLRVAAEMPERFARLVILNTFLPTGEEKPSLAFLAWKQFAKRTPVLPVSRIIRTATVQPLSREVASAYDAPFPDRTYQAGAKAFPELVPVSPDMPGAAEMKQTRAALDVFAQEPLPASSPLWRLPNVILSPHVSGFTPHYDERAMALFAENLRRYVKGEELLNIVDIRRGY